VLLAGNRGCLNREGKGGLTVESNVDKEGERLDGVQMSALIARLKTSDLLTQDSRIQYINTTPPNPNHSRLIINCKLKLSARFPKNTGHQSFNTRL